MYLSILSFLLSNILRFPVSVHLLDTQRLPNTNTYINVNGELNTSLCLWHKTFQVTQVQWRHQHTGLMATFSHLVSEVHLLCFSSFCLRSSSFSLSRVSTFCWKISSCWLSFFTCPEQRNEIWWSIHGKEKLGCWATSLWRSEGIIHRTPGKCRVLTCFIFYLSHIFTPLDLSLFPRVWKSSHYFVSQLLFRFN